MVFHVRSENRHQVRWWPPRDVWTVRPGSRWQHGFVRDGGLTVHGQTGVVTHPTGRYRCHLAGWTKPKLRPTFAYTVARSELSAVQKNDVEGNFTVIFLWFDSMILERYQNFPGWKRNWSFLVKKYFTKIYQNLPNGHPESAMFLGSISSADRHAVTRLKRPVLRFQHEVHLAKINARFYFYMLKFTLAWVKI